jgi:predicted DsbA family dithiol-disulfide isomerase
MNMSKRETTLDRRVQARLATDQAYKHAANAEEQAAREEEITAEEDYKLPCAVIDESRWI